MRPALIIVVLLLSVSAYAQTNFQALVKNAETEEPLTGATATLKNLGKGASANENGLITIENVPDGNYSIIFSFIGFKSQTITVTFPQQEHTILEILLEPEEETLAEIFIISTRSSRTIADIPTRVEFIAGEELDEKGNMKPGDIRMLLNESTGIQTQQTSPTSANASIRVQGLDGRYTQILKDGFPLYAGFSSGLGLLQTPPLDLRQVEVIKGSSSTLYGGGAIAGLLNLISKAPTEEREMKFLVNGTSAKGLDISGFYGKKFEKVGATFFASRNTNEPYDPADIGLTAIPKFQRYTLNPKIFFDLSDKTSMNLGLNFTSEDRIGGDLQYIEGNGDATHRYFERNDSKRYSTQFSFSHKLTSTLMLNVRNSLNHFERNISIPEYEFKGNQNSSFTEINISHQKNSSEVIGGVNVWTDNFEEEPTTEFALRNYSQTTFGAFVQSTISLNKTVSLESGIRGDYVIDYGFVLLPRFSFFYKANERFTSRLGAGLGYKAPTIFTEEAERVHYQNVLPLTGAHKLERSWGANWDMNYHAEIGDIGFSVNHLFFYTYLKNPLLLVTQDVGNYTPSNIPGYLDTKGTETNLKLEYGDFKLFIGYTYTDTKKHNDGVSVRNPLTAKHRLNNVLMFEVEEKWKMGLEAYYFSSQRLTDKTLGKSYWICGFMTEKIWEHLSVFINFENFLDARQTKFDTIYTGPISTPVFRDIYAPVDGFVINGGLKINL